MVRVVQRILSLVRSLRRVWPKSAVDIDMFAGENQSVAYLSDVDMERIGINCGDYVFVGCVVEEEDDLLLDAEEASAIDQNKTTEHSVIAMAWSHSKAPPDINFSLLLRRTFGFRNTEKMQQLQSVKIYLDRVILKNEEMFYSSIGYNCPDSRSFYAKRLVIPGQSEIL